MIAQNNQLISVIIPAYNHENYIEDTINSIINQTYQNIELIVIDDGSKDNTWKKLNELKENCEKRFSRVIFKTQENKGTCVTLNTLFSLTQGDYIYLIASDDMAKPNALEKEMQFLCQNPDYGLVVGDNEFINENSKICYWDKQQNSVYDTKAAQYKSFGQFLQKTRCIDFKSKDFGTYHTLYAGNYIPNGYLMTKLAAKTFLPLTKEAPLEDWYIMLQISKYYKMKYIDEILFSYRWHSENSIKQNTRMKIVADSTSRFEEEILKNIDTKKVFPDVVKILQNGCIHKSSGIPGIFEIINLKKRGQYYKILKLFNIVIYRKPK